MSSTGIVIQPSTISLCDPSELYRPEKKHKDLFRNYKENCQTEKVRKTYNEMHTNQTVEFVKSKIDYWTRFDKAELTIMEALRLLNGLVDESDPDIDVPNIFHAFQTAERIRQAHPNHEWFSVVGLIHDLGKIMALWGEPQWCVVGDTFIVGCEPAPSVVFRETSFKNNPDLQNPLYNTKYGMYSEHIGLENVLMSWGHDEYMYRVLKYNKSTIPEEGLYMIRFHSFYPWHSGEDYHHIISNKDESMLPWVREFNKFDLYSKSDDIPDIEKLIPYYQTLIDKYCPGKLKW